MNRKTPLFFGIIAVLCPFFGAGVMLFFENEPTEALLGGALLGCIAGSLFGIAALRLNRERKIAVTVLSVLPMCPLACFLLMAIPFLLYR